MGLNNILMIKEISMSVLVVSSDTNSLKVQEANKILHSLGADIIRYQTVNKSALPDPQNLLIHDFVVLIKDKLLPEHIKTYKSYMKNLDIKEVEMIV